MTDGTKVYLVTYDLFRAPELYQSLYRELTTGFDSWSHYISGTWLIRTHLDSQGIFRRLRPHIEPESNLLVVEAGKDIYGWLPAEAFDWMREAGLGRPPAATPDALATSA